MSSIDDMDLPPCLIYIDKEGRWYHQGAEMIHRAFIRLFYEHMELDSRNRYVITWQGKPCYVDVEDTAFVILRVNYEEGQQDRKSRFFLSLSDDSVEELDPETLFVGESNVLYCSVKDGSFPARFNRAAYYQLAEYVWEDKGAFYLSLDGKRHEISARGE